MSKAVGKNITLNDLLENPVEDLEIPEWGTVKVRLPYTEEKIQARVEASKQLGFEALSTTEQANEISRRTSLKMIQEPKISNEDYLKGNDLKLSILLDTVAMWYAIQAKKLNDKRKTMINDFLEQMRESSP